MPSGEVESHLFTTGTTWRPKIIMRCKLVGLLFKRVKLAKIRSTAPAGEVKLERNTKWPLVSAGEKDRGSDEVGKFRVGQVLRRVLLWNVSVKKIFC